MEAVETVLPETAGPATSAPDEEAHSKNMQVSMVCPVSAYQTIVGRTKGNPDYIVTLHKLFGTFVECATMIKH